MGRKAARSERTPLKKWGSGGTTGREPRLLSWEACTGAGVQEEESSSSV